MYSPSRSGSEPPNRGNRYKDQTIFSYENYKISRQNIKRESLSEVSTVSTDLSKSVSSPNVSNRREKKFIVDLLMGAEKKKQKVFY